MDEEIIDDYNELVELTPETYFNFTQECALEIKDTREKIDELETEFDDKERFILASKEEIRNLKKSIRVTKKEQRGIKKVLGKHERSLSVDIEFLNELNNTVNKKRGGAHLVDYQKRKILRG